MTYVPLISTQILCSEAQIHFLYTVSQTLLKVSLQKQVVPDIHASPGYE